MSNPPGYELTREELYRIRSLKLLTNDRDYLYFALQIDYPSKLNPTIEVDAFCERWEMTIGNFYRAVGELKNKGIVLSLSSQLDLQMQG